MLHRWTTVAAVATGLAGLALGRLTTRRTEALRAEVRALADATVRRVDAVMAERIAELEAQAAINLRQRAALDMGGVPHLRVLP